MRIHKATVVLVATLLTSALAAQSRDTLAERVDAVMSRPEFRHAIFGIEFYDLDANAVVYEHNSDRFFVGPYPRPGRPHQQLVFEWQHLIRG